ncbi:hypothetical protein ACHAQJ_006323 [Trichoderma viride]
MAPSKKNQALPAAETPHLSHAAVAPTDTASNTAVRSSDSAPGSTVNRTELMVMGRDSDGHGDDDNEVVETPPGAVATGRCLATTSLRIADGMNVLTFLKINNGTAGTLLQTELRHRRLVHRVLVMHARAQSARLQADLATASARLPGDTLDDEADIKLVETFERTLAAAPRLDLDRNCGRATGAQLPQRLDREEAEVDIDIVEE